MKISGVILYDQRKNEHVAGALKFLAESLVLTLKDLGHTDAALEHGIYMPSFGTWIVLGAHTNPQWILDYKDSGARFIIYNTEHPASGWWNVKAYQTLHKEAFAWWDYCGECNGSAIVVPQSHPEQRVLPPSTQKKDIDVFFAGSQCVRRQSVITALINSGLVVVHAFNVYGRKLDELVDCSRVCLNMHYYDNPPVFESVRVSHLLSRGARVISEDDPADIAKTYPGVLAAVPYNDLVRAVLDEIHTPRALPYVRPGTMHVDLVENLPQ